MLGAIAGDIIGSVYERHNTKRKDFPLFQPSSHFTDDTVLTLAIADALLHQQPYEPLFKQYFHAYPEAGYGRSFRQWAQSSAAAPYGSWGNGSAMRISPISYWFDDLATVRQEARCSAAVTHNHPEGIRGAEAIASAIFLARTGASKPDIKQYVESSFNYDLNVVLDELREHYEFDVSCQGSVPPAIAAFLQSTDFEDAIRTAVSIGGDSDTIACMCGGIAEAFYGGIPDAILQEIWQRLPPALSHITEQFLAAAC